MGVDTVDGFVLVHGGFHGAWCWEQVQPLLSLPSVAVDLPGRGSRPFTDRRVMFADCVDAVIADADAAGFGRFVLVGHSMGGLTVTSTAAAHPQRVAHAVYLAALAPPVGVSVNQLFQVPTTPDLDPVGRVPVPDLATATAMFSADLDVHDAARAHARCVPEPNGLFLDTIATYRHGVPVTYIGCTRDAVVPAALVDLCIANLEPPVTVRTLDSDHDAMLSHPAATAAALDAVLAAPNGN